MSTHAPASPTIIDERPRAHHVCPWWVGYLISSPLRKLGEDPDALLAPLVEPGMTVLDVGCAMGFFSLPLARMVGPTGRVVCVDVQQRMLTSLERRARRRRVEGIIETRLCTQENLALDDLRGGADLALAVHVVHESAYPGRFLAQIRDALCPSGRLLVVEPTGHVPDAEFDSTRGLCREIGLTEVEHSRLRRSRMLLLERERVGPG